MLPPGTIKALKGHHEGVVTVVLVAVTLGSILAGVPVWAAVVVLAVAMVSYHPRCTAKERHAVAVLTEQTKQEALKVASVRARYRELNATEQPELPFFLGGRSPVHGRSGRKGQP